VIIISLVTTLIAYEFDLKFNIDLTLLSIAIIFPLVFTIRGSFRRREKALEHLSKFRSALQTVRYFVLSTKDLSEQNKEEISTILFEISEQTMQHLHTKDQSTKDLDDIIGNVYRFFTTKDELVTKGLRGKVFRFMRDLHDAIENLHAIHVHRTPISLKAYCKMFIYIFPLIYVPTIIYNLGPNSPQWIVYFVVILTEFILISLYNIQDQLEYPFDDYGLDDIKLDNFKIDR
jgi:predicted membrane chloride channel (bestrophin family)